jgi:hypothetical protein
MSCGAQPTSAIGRLLDRLGVAFPDEVGGMSVRSLTRVWEHSKACGTDLLMMLAIADFSDDDGNAYPSVATLARKCRMKPRNAQYILAVLQNSGELDVRKNAGPKGANRYRLRFDAMGAGAQSAAPLQDSAPLQRSARGGAKDCAKPLHCIAPEPSLNRQEPSGSAADATAAHASMPAKERVWLLGPALLGERGRSLLGKLSKQYTDEVLAEVLCEAATQKPIDPKSWIVQACEARKTHRGTAANPLSNPTPAWATNAGFSNRFEAENAGCREGSAHLFRDGRRIVGGRTA